MNAGDVLDSIEEFYAQEDTRASLAISSRTSPFLATGASLGRAMSVRRIVGDSGVPLTDVFEENRRREDAGDDYTPWGCLTAAYPMEHMQWKGLL